MCDFLGDGAFKWGEGKGVGTRLTTWALTQSGCCQGRSNHDVEIKSMQSMEGQLWRTQFKVPSASQQRDLGRTSPASTRSRKQLSSVEAPACGILL